MTCTWRNHHGAFVVLIPLDEAHGKGTYHVEAKDGTSRDVMIHHVGTVPHVRFEDGVECYVGDPDQRYRDRAAGLEPLTHAPLGPHAPRLTKARDTVIAPESVILRAIERNEPIEIDGLRVWVEHDHDLRVWPVEGVRMARVPIAAAMVSAS